MHTNFRETFHIRSDNKQYNAAYPNGDARSVPIDSWWENVPKCKRFSTWIEIASRAGVNVDQVTDLDELLVSLIGKLAADFKLQQDSTDPKDDP